MDIEEIVEAVASAKSWDRRVAAIRKIPEEFGSTQQLDAHSEVARNFYVPTLAPDFAYMHWRPEYEIKRVEEAYNLAYRCSNKFRKVDVSALETILRKEPTTILIFRLLLGFTPSEFAQSTKSAAEQLKARAVTSTNIKRMEAGGKPEPNTARLCAITIDLGMRARLFPKPTGNLRSKLEKPDTKDGWKSVRNYVDNGVPFPMFLHQRHYGGAFNQILNATSTARGNILEDAVDALFQSAGLLYVRTSSGNQKEISRRFGITVKPTPDFVVFDRSDTARAMLECKGANDGGTARDKAARFSELRNESQRLNGIPVFAVLAGMGWARTRDALGPVIRDTDGRTFTLATLQHLVAVQPFPQLILHA